MVQIYVLGKEVQVSDKVYLEMKNISEQMRKKRVSCRQVCPTWNKEDRDCEVYGSNHPSPSNCSYYLIGKANKRLKNL